MAHSGGTACKNAEASTLALSMGGAAFGAGMARGTVTGGGPASNSVDRWGLGFPH